LTTLTADSNSPHSAGPFIGLDGLAMLLLALAVTLVSLGTTLVAALWVVMRTAARPAAPLRPGEAAWAVVLGTKLERAYPGPVFRSRLDCALALANADPELRVAVLGGVTTGGAQAEAAAGRVYLRRAGLPESRIWVETRSRHTLENLREFRGSQVPAGSSESHSVVLVTSPSHLARALRMAATFGLSVVPCPATRLSWQEWKRLPIEAVLLHWYWVGSSFAHATRNAHMLRRIS
jgi:uncharacterized SAM-binding protein YcdF (DUF218 family)